MNNTSNISINDIPLGEDLDIVARQRILSRKLDDVVQHFSSKAAKAKQLFYLYKYSSIVLAALTTMAASLQTIYPTETPLWILPILSAASTVAVTLLGASSAQSIWTNSKTTQQRLQAEKIYFLQQAEKYKEKTTKEARLQCLAEQFIIIWNQGHNKWEQGITS